jgi:hypothetical protein
MIEILFRSIGRQQTRDGFADTCLIVCLIVTLLAVAASSVGEAAASSWTILSTITQP